MVPSVGLWLPGGRKRLSCASKAEQGPARRPGGCLRGDGRGWREGPVVEGRHASLGTSVRRSVATDGRAGQQRPATGPVGRVYTGRPGNGRPWREVVVAVRVPAAWVERGGWAKGQGCNCRPFQVPPAISDAAGPLRLGVFGTRPGFLRFWWRREWTRILLLHGVGGRPLQRDARRFSGAPGAGMAGTPAHSGEIDHPFRREPDRRFRRKPITCRSDAGLVHGSRCSRRADGRHRLRMDSAFCSSQ